MKDIIEIYRMLHWHSSYGEQLFGIEAAKEIDDLSLLIQPMHPEYNKSIWDNCARVLYEKTDDVLSPYLAQLFKWVEDLNWPGALIILDRLKIFSGQELKQPLESLVNSIMGSINEQDSMWLGNLSLLLKNESLRGELSQDVKRALEVDRG